MINAQNIVYSTSEPDEKTGRVTITANLRIYATFECEQPEAIRSGDEIEKSLRFKIADTLFADAKRILTDLYMAARHPPLDGSLSASESYFEAIKERFESVRAALTIKEESEDEPKRSHS